MRTKWQVLVGNIGSVFNSRMGRDDEMAARETYWLYVRYSQDGYGRAAGEPVTLIHDGEIILHHEGKGDE